MVVKWQQTGQFNKYPLSRYTIRVNSADDEDVLNEMNQVSNLEKSKETLLNSAILDPKA